MTTTTNIDKQQHYTNINNGNVICEHLTTLTHEVSSFTMKSFPGLYLTATDAKFETDSGLGCFTGGTMTAAGENTTVFELEIYRFTNFRFALDLL